MTNYEIIKDAILNKRIITATFNGYLRIMCPHVLGTKGRVKQALFYQFAGESKTGLSLDPNENWRCIPIDLLRNVSSADGEWRTASNHSKPSRCIDIIEVQVVF